MPRVYVTSGMLLPSHSRTTTIPSLMQRVSLAFIKVPPREAKVSLFGLLPPNDCPKSLVDDRIFKFPAESYW